MCTTCGCAGDGQVLYTDPATGKQMAISSGGRPRAPAAVATGNLSYVRYEPRAHDHSHSQPTALPHAHALAHLQASSMASNAAVHSHRHDSGNDAIAALSIDRPSHTIALEQQILAKNQALAELNRAWFTTHSILALNLMSSPGSGKTTLLERTIRDIGGELSIQVIEGDQATLRDAERIRATGARVIQINTGTGCHLEADMLQRGLEQLQPPRGSLVMIENVGNLVCPALFDLGERAKVVILSVTEGEDKPIKYPHMFRASEVMLLNKIDLLPHLQYDIERCIACAREVNPDIKVLRVSATTGEGMDAWYAWLRSQAAP